MILNSFKVSKMFVKKGDVLTFTKHNSLYFTKGEKYEVEITNELGFYVSDDNESEHFHHWDKAHNKFILFLEDKI